MMKLLVRDASNTRFDDASFDLVFSFNVFEHLPEPQIVIKEIIRLLRPGGGFLLSFPHFAHPNALHDLRYTTRAANAPPPWAHLIPEELRLVNQGAFINDIRLDMWKELFREHCPGVAFAHKSLQDPKLMTRIRQCRERGLLSGFTDEELMTEELKVAWRKQK
jgi:SAM-dependent methyltransferase